LRVRKKKDFEGERRKVAKSKKYPGLQGLSADCGRIDEQPDVTSTETIMAEGAESLKAIKKIAMRDSEARVFLENNEDVYRGAVRNRKARSRQ
jgi:hypothetical protein